MSGAAASNPLEVLEVGRQRHENVQGPDENVPSPSLPAFLCQAAGMQSSACASDAKKNARNAKHAPPKKRRVTRMCWQGARSLLPALQQFTRSLPLAALRWRLGLMQEAAQIVNAQLKEVSWAGRGLQGMCQLRQKATIARLQ